MSPAAPTPTPTPILAPVDRPLVSVAPSFERAGTDGTVGTAGMVGPVCVEEVVLVWPEAFVSDDSVVIAETNRLLSEACSWIWIACAHIVTGPETCVLSWSTWRTVTIVDDELGKLLRHPANVVVESLGSS